MAGRGVTGEASPQFARALRALRGARLRPEVRITEVPPPTRIAPYAVALTAEVHSDALAEVELATGRFVLLHDPSAPEPWEGVWRAVTFVRAELEPELVNDPVLGLVGWSWLADALDARGVDRTAEAGTVTRVVSESFGTLSDKPPTVEMEIRASWTPAGTADDAGIHLAAWADLLCTVAGLPPLPDGVVALPGRRR